MPIWGETMAKSISFNPIALKDAVKYILLPSYLCITVSFSYKDIIRVWYHSPLCMFGLYTVCIPDREHILIQTINNENKLKIIMVLIVLIW